MSRFVKLFAIVALVAITAPAFAQGTTATLLDGTVLTIKQPLELFATEGPIWDVDVANQTITVTGKTLTFPLTIDGVELLISGSSVLGQDGEAATGIGAANFDRLLDTNATTRDASPERLGPTRSIFSSTESGRTDPTAPVTRSAAAQAQIEQNYFDILQACYATHNPALLPPNFLDLCGIRASGNQYPATAGGTLKSAGHVYVDALGNEYLVTDIEAVIELSENVASGIVRSISPPTPGVPGSFIVNDLLIIMNQDPRFSSDALGVGEGPINNDVFFALGLGETIDTIGHTVGEHVLFVQEVLTQLVDPAAGLIVTADRFRFRDGNNEIRFRGIVGQIGGVALSAEILGQQFPIALAVDPLEGVSAYSFRSRGQVNVSLVESVDLRASNPEGGPGAAPLFEGTFIRAEVAE